MTEDPFERAAEREEKEEFRRELRRQQMWQAGRRNTSSMLTTLGIPYVVWALIRAANYEEFGEPTMGRSLLDFFFGRPGFGIFTGLMIVFFWMWAVEKTTRH